jgi:hypothetical protein
MAGQKSPEYAVYSKTIYNYVFFYLKGELKKLALEDFRRRGGGRGKRR